MQAELNARLAAMADREELADLVRRERFARDQRRFDVMRACFDNDAHIRTSWFDGGADDYVAQSVELVRRSPNGKHWVFPGFHQIHGDKATIESPAMIFNSFVMHGVEVQMQVYCRFHSRAVRRDGRWFLASFEVLFEHDMLRPLSAAELLPVDWTKLATFRRSYRFLTHVQETRGVTVNPDLYGDDRLPELDAFHAAEQRWLLAQDGDVPCGWPE